MASTEGKKKLWGGRFSGETDPLMEKFNESLHFDRRMAQEDCEGSMAYAKALSKSGVITEEEASTLVEGLKLVAEEWSRGEFQVVSGDEDIHTANERRLSELVGAVGGKLHTGRSRNDQVATDTRLWLYRQLLQTRGHLQDLIRIAADRAEREVDVVMPGFTHLQPAQTVRWSHWLLSHAAAWQRDDERLRDLLPRVARLPLGSGALAGNPFNVDRQFLAGELGFVGGVCPNSMDAVSDRDFVIETMFWGTLTSTHLSRWAEDLIIYSSGQFGMVQCSDAYSTGSSLMPQKKNPDALELLRGKAGRCLGQLTGMIAVMKGTPTTYNKDFQEDKQPLFDLVDTMQDCLQIAAGCLATLRINPDKMRSGLSADMLATDLAEYLVRKGVPFRETHHMAGAAVKLAEERNCQLSDLTADDLKPICDLFEEDVSEVWSFDASAEKRDTEGGTSSRSVLEQDSHLSATPQKCRIHLHDGRAAGEHPKGRLHSSPGRPFVLPFLRSVVPRDSLSTAMLTSSFPTVAPVYQLSQYYKFGELDDCRQKWSDLLECMRNKASKKSVEVEELSTRTALWEMRTKDEAQSFWRKEFGGDGNVGKSHTEKSNIV